MNKLKAMAIRFADDEEGIALTEYLVLLGLVVAGVIAAVLSFGAELSAVWGSWTAWLKGNALDAPSGSS